MTTADLLVLPVTPANSTVLGYSHAKWIAKWWRTGAKWNTALPTASARVSGRNGSVGGLHVECRDPRLDGAVYRVRSRVAIGGKLRGRVVLDVRAAKAPGVGCGWCWVFTVERGKRGL